MALIPFLVGGAAGAVALVITKNSGKALAVWTIVLLVVLLVASVGGIRLARP